MKITIDKREFTKALSRAAAVADKKSTLPLLSCVHIATGVGAVSVTATDLYIESESLVSATIDTKGAMAVSGDGDGYGSGSGSGSGSGDGSGSG